MSGERATPEAEGEEREQRKLDVKKLVAVIPPPSALMGRRQGQAREKRIRLRYCPDVSPEQAKISSRLAKELGITEFVEMTVAGRKRFRFKVVIDDTVPYDYIFVNPDLMRQYGIADNSMCTIRRG
ncbi:MAG: hypothetical protein GXO32_04595 [Crenarchaeota archaeon]|nr:hypothetical protein [Thermoproteota archaeon]